jgi:hypothetical protein
VRVKGGHLGPRSVWTRNPLAQLDRIHSGDANGRIEPELVARAAELTESNAAFFDAANDFHGVIAGCHEVLRRQGLLEGIWCLDPKEDLSPGQAAEIDRVYRLYPHLNDDAFVRDNLSRWLG